MLVILGYVLAGLIERGIQAGLGRVPGFDQTLRHFFATAARRIARRSSSSRRNRSASRATPSPMSTPPASGRAGWLRK
jgi:hypothetical protein